MYAAAAAKSLQLYIYVNMGFLGGSDQGRICRQCRRLSFDPWLWKTPGEGNGSPLQYSCLENSMDRGAWWATILGVMKSHT